MRSIIPMRAASFTDGPRVDCDWRQMAGTRRRRHSLQRHSPIQILD